MHLSLHPKTWICIIRKYGVSIFLPICVIRPNFVLD